MELFGWLYTICFAICYIPQITKSIKTRKVNDVSISLFTLSLLGYVSGIIYTHNTLNNNIVLLANYYLGALCSLIMIVTYYMFSKKLSVDF